MCITEKKNLETRDEPANPRKPLPQPAETRTLWCG